MDVDSIEPGQEVWLYDVNRKDRTRGTVVRVGRKLVTIRYEYGAERAFRLDDGYSNDNYRHQYFRTDAQAEQHDRREAAVEALRAVGLDVRRDCRLSLPVLESLAAAVGENA